ncbi:MAG: FmdE family protein [Methanomicrobiales archaeon]|nr:FmdE family protein [Methanomicrobiales archaeon]
MERNSSERYPSFEEVVQFHGHACPGLAGGYRAAVAAMQALGVARPYDEELACIAETDACGVDAIQLVCGCTAGKGNLVVKDYGKHVFTVISRESGRAVRVLVRNADIPERSEMDALRKEVFSGRAASEERERFQALMRRATERILKLPEEKVVAVREAHVEPPSQARIFASIVCGCCGEAVADARTLTLDGLQVCIPCYEARHPPHR